MVDRLEIPASFKNADNAILLSRVKDGIQPQATWGWIRAMYLFLLQACQDLEADTSNCTELRQICPGSGELATSSQLLGGERK